MGQIEKRLIDEKEVILLGQVLENGPGKRVREILHKTFTERLSYTRGEPEHTAFLEGQKSVLQFIDNAVKAARSRTEVG